METLLWILAAISIIAAILLLSAARAAAAHGAAAEAAVPPLGRFVSVTAADTPLKLHYVRLGPTENAADPPARPPILMIHGLGGSLRHFTATIADDLARDHRVFAIDRPGAGYSERPAAGAAHLVDQARLLGAALDALEETAPPLLIGHSFGGAVALSYALQRPVAGLLLLAPATHRFRIKPPLPDRTIDSAWARRLIAYTVGPQGIAKTRAQNLGVAFGPQAEPAEFAVAGGGRLMMRPSQINAVFEDGALLRGDLDVQAPNYGEIKAPILVLFGDQDRMLNAQDHGPPLQRKAPQTELRRLQGLGHMLPFAAPEIVCAAAREMTDAARDATNAS